MRRRWEYHRRNIASRNDEQSSSHLGHTVISGEQYLD